MKKYLLTLSAALLSLAAAAEDYNLNKPFGFCTVSSRTETSSTYDITGGGIYTYPTDGFTGKVIILKSNSQDQQAAIQNAIKQNDVVILDGADGEFIVSSNVGISASNKTIIGINNACISTKWYIDEEIKDLLNNATDDRTPAKKGVKNMSTSSDDNLGGTVAGQTIKEQAEYITRKLLYEKYKNENYRKSGCITLNGCQNVIIRNITFKGPGSLDAAGNDLIVCTGAKHCWIDHCEFMDGMDGNFDITNSADFNTISWCIFRYTERSYMHQNTNLIGSSDSEAKGYLNTTFAFNWWASGCNQRMPMGRVGKIHMLNNYYTCTGASLCMNPRINSEFLIEGNYFAAGVTKCYRNNDATAVTWADDNTIPSGASKPTSFGTKVTVPYTYTVAPTADVPAAVEAGAGATLPYGEERDEPDPADGVSGSIMWPFNVGGANQASSISASFGANIASTSVTLGDDLSYDGTQNISSIGKETKIKANVPNAPSPAASNAITFKFTPASGYKFKCAKVSVTATKIGTDGGKIDITWNDVKEIKLGTALTPKRNSTPSGKPSEDPFYTTYEYDIKNQSTATNDPCSLVINLYALGQTGSLKDYGFCNIMIQGNLIDSSTGISTPVVIKGDGHIYNLRGQRVDESYKGIVIKNGKKYIQK